MPLTRDPEGAYAERRNALRARLGRSGRELLRLSDELATEGYDSIAHEIRQAIRERQQGRRREAAQTLYQAAENAGREGLPRPQTAQVLKTANRWETEEEYEPEG